MESIFDQIEGTIAAGFPYPAVCLALSVPDICASLELPPGANMKGKNKARYIVWYEKWLSDRYPEVTGQDLYALRNGLLHNGSFGHRDLQYDRIIFLFMGRRVIHRNILNGALQLDARIFCRDMIESGRAWQACNRENRDVIRNMTKLFQIYSDGLAPYIAGMPVIG